MAVIEQEVMPTTIDITPILYVTSAAVEVIRNLLQQRNIPNHSLRVSVSGGGCSGMQYGMAFEESPKEFDKVVAMDGVSLIVDSTSLMYLQGATIDYVDSLMGGGFRIEKLKLLHRLVNLLGDAAVIEECGHRHERLAKLGGVYELRWGWSAPHQSFLCLPHVHAPCL